MLLCTSMITFVSDTQCTQDFCQGLQEAGAHGQGVRETD